MFYYHYCLLSPHPFCVLWCGVSLYWFVLVDAVVAAIIAVVAAFVFVVIVVWLFVVFLYVYLV